MEIDQEALFQTFLAESEEGLSAIEEALTVLEREPGDEESLGTVFRAAHTLKGNAITLGFSRLSDVAHVLEDLLERLRSRTVAVDSNLVTLLLQAVDVLREMVPRSVRDDDRLLPAAKTVVDALSLAARGHLVPEPLRRPVSFPAAEVVEEAPRNDPDPRGGTGHRRASLRVGLEKLDRLMDLTGEVCIARGQITQMLEDHSLPKDAVLEAQREADFLYMELQELVTKLRMVPVGPMFRHHIRTVRDLARSHGRQAKLAITGDDVEVDMTVIEQLRDPLNHMIRNALDHGLEAPHIRRAAGKDDTGQITLRAYHDAGMIVIELEDDGAGLDLERIAERARSRGMKVDGLTEREIHDLVFTAGFSTAERVTDLSGRGVGLDVVRRNIEVLRGTVGISSRTGEGTRFTIRLPLTLAIIDGFHVGVGIETYIIPMESVVETLAFPGGERDVEQGLLNLRGNALPFVRLRNLFHVEGALPARQSVVVIHHAGSHAGIVVDRLLGHSQTVIKPLGQLLQGLPGLSGSAILPSGEVAFILDVQTLLRRCARARGPSVVQPERGIVPQP